MSLLVLPKNGLHEWPHPHASPRVLLEESNRVTRMSVETVWATATCAKPESSTNAAAMTKVNSLETRVLDFLATKRTILIRPAANRR